MIRIKPYLQLCRAHTAPLETVPAYIGAVLAIGSLTGFGVFIWAVFGYLYHVIGYSMNSYADWKAGYDKNDPYKQHHPLNTGKLSPDTAKLFIYTLFALGTIYTIYIIPNLAGYIVFAIAVIFGVLYNTIGKKTEFKFVFISIAHTGVFVLPYISLGGTINSLDFILGVIIMFLWIVFQISVSGEIKDITVDEENFLQSLDTVATDNRVEFGSLVRYYSYGLKLVTVGLALIIASQYSNLYTYAGIILFSAPILFATFKLVSDGEFNRSKRLLQMSLIEGFTASLFVVMYSHILGILTSVVIIAASFIYVFMGNKYLWGTLMAPQV